MFVADIMSKQVHTVRPSDRLSNLRDIFSEVSYRHLLVEDEGKLVGVVSDRDVLSNLSPFLDTNREREDDRAQLRLMVKDIMSTGMITLDAETLIDSASILLLENNISCLPVVTENMEIDGILSWKDILEYQVYGVDRSLD